MPVLLSLKNLAKTGPRIARAKLTRAGPAEHVVKTGTSAKERLCQRAAAPARGKDDAAVRLT
jgi:hypothetical protein